MTHPGFQRAGRAAGDVDYFELFDLPSSFHIDTEELERRYLERSRLVHPDRFVSAPARERVAALQQSMQLNDAYKTLIKPGPRAEYLLSRHGITIGGNEQLDPEFLMSVMELREELAEAKQAGDRPLLRRLEESMLDRRDRALEEIGGWFAEIDRGAGDAEPLWQRVKGNLILLRYINRYIEELDDLDDEDES